MISVAASMLAAWISMSLIRKSMPDWQRWGLLAALLLTLGVLFK